MREISTNQDCCSKFGNPASKLRKIKLKFLYQLFILTLISLYFSNVKAQDSLWKRYTDINKIKFADAIEKTVSSCYIIKEQDPEINYATQFFQPGIQHLGSVPNDFITRKLLLKFNICNSADSAVSIYFFPGFYYQNIQLFRLNGTIIKKLPAILPDDPDSIGFRKISLAANDSATILAALSFVKTHINKIRPRLVNPAYVPAYITELRGNHDPDNRVTYIFCGLLLMMIFFSLTNFFQGANREFLYYSGFAFFLGAMLLTKAMYDLHISPISFFLEGYLDFILQGIGYIFYLTFMQRFLETKTQHPFLYKLYISGVSLLIISMLGYTYFHYYSDDYAKENLVENATKLLLLAMVVIFLFYSIRNRKDKLMYYLFWGNCCLFVFSLLSQLAVMRANLFAGFPGILSTSLFYYEVGLFLELVFFLAGLNYKNRSQLIEQTKERETLKAQNQLKEYEKEIAVYKAQQEERERISADMHDELGSGMTAIRLMSEIARNKMKENTPVEIDKISSSADDVLNKMNAIIWSMNSGNDTLDNLISYIRSWSQEYFENTAITCNIFTPTNIPEKEITGAKRRNIFLCVKESLNNVLKHSAATTVTIKITTDQTLTIEIADNGTGIDMQNLRRFGNGLKNIAYRMETIDGRFHIENRNGTVTTLALPL